MAPKRQSTRRDFLKGQAAVDALGDLAQGAASEARSGKAAGERKAESYLLHFSRRAMACEFQVYLNAGQYDHATDAAVAALDLVDALEAQMTVYRDDSELSRINARAGEEAVEVEPRLFELLQAAVKLYEETGGALDITSGPLSKVWGFYRRAGRMPEEAKIGEALRRVDSRHVELDGERRTVRFRRAGVELNLGSIGKGYALDRCAEQLGTAGVGDFLLHGGQSSVLARGGRGVAEERCGWVVGVVHPLWRQKRLAEVRLVDQALGTSGSGAQFFHHQGRRYGHILDPRSGWPAEGVLSTTVVAPTAAAADALATAAYVMGAEATLEYCQAHREVAALVVTPGARPGAVEVHSAGFAEGQLTMLEESAR